MRILVLVLLFCCISTSAMALDCFPRKPQEFFVRITGALEDLVEIRKGDLYHGNTLVAGDYHEMRESNGVLPHQLDCARVHINGDLIIVEAGWKHDIGHAYAVVRDAKGAILGVQLAVLRFRDGRMEMVFGDYRWDIFATFGQHHDLTLRLCFGAHRGKMIPEYKPTEWGYDHTEPRHGGRFPPCNGRLQTGTYENSGNFGQWFIPIGTTK